MSKSWNKFDLFFSCIFSPISGQNQIQRKQPSQIKPTTASDPPNRMKSQNGNLKDYANQYGRVTNEITIFKILSKENLFFRFQGDFLNVRTAHSRKNQQINVLHKHCEKSLQPEK